MPKMAALSAGILAFPIIQTCVRGAFISAAAATVALVVIMPTAPGPSCH